MKITKPKGGKKLKSKGKRGLKEVKDTKELESPVIIHQYVLKERYKNACQYAKAATAALKGKGKIITGADVAALETRRVLTGIPHLDYVTNGGLVRGGVIEFWGKKKSGKTTHLAHMVRNFQARGMVVLLASIETFVKPWWRQIGVFIPYNQREMDELVYVFRKKAEKYNKFFEDKKYTPLSLIVHEDSVQALELVYRAHASNNFDLIAVDSLGPVIDSKTVEKKNLADIDFAGSSVIFTRFMKKIIASQNYYFDEENKRSPTGNFSNQTMLCCINQARATIGAEKCTWDELLHSVGGNALEHLWDQSIAFQVAKDANKGTKQAVSFDGGVKQDVFARRFDCKATKMKVGPEQREVKFQMAIKAYEQEGRSFRPGQFNNVSSVRAICAMLGVTQQKAAFIYFEGEKFHGKPAIEKALYDRKGFYQKMYDVMMKKSEEDADCAPVPEVWNYVT